MRTFALSAALVLLCASSTLAAGETFSLRWIEDQYCDAAAPFRRVAGGTLTVVSDTEWDLCTDLFICALGSNTPVTGTTTRISPRRAVFVGRASSNLVWTGPLMIEADLGLGADGEVRSVRGTFIAPAVEDAYCAARGRFRNTKRTH